MSWLPESRFGKKLRRAAIVTFLGGLTYTAGFAAANTLDTTPPSPCVASAKSHMCRVAIENRDRNGYEGYGEGLGTAVLGALTLLERGLVERKVFDLTARNIIDDAEFLVGAVGEEQ